MDMLQRAREVSLLRFARNDTCAVLLSLRGAAGEEAISAGFSTIGKGLSLDQGRSHNEFHARPRSGGNFRLDIRQGQ